MDYHIPVLLNESIEALQVRPEGKYVDTTFGAGGHSKPILKQLSAKGHLYGFDQDMDVADNLLNHECFTFIRSNFRHIRRFMRLYEVEELDGVLMDLGVSSHQFDMADRGFSYRFDAELDMRMNREASMDGREVLNTYSADALQGMFSRYGEVRNSRTLSESIVSARNHRPITTTFQLNAILDGVKMGPSIKYYSQVYQAIRIEVNDEEGALIEALEGSMDCLKKGGRIVVISYHSLEDRVVKNFFKAGNAEGFIQKDEYGNIQKPMKQINKKLILPSKEEVKKNRRARSAKMRIGEKV